MYGQLQRKVIGIMSVTLLAFFTTASAQFSKAKLQATGLTCALCSKSIHQALEKLPFVATVQPELKTSTFDIQFKEDQAVSVASIRTAVEDAGFFIGSLKLMLSGRHALTDHPDKAFEHNGSSYRFLTSFKPSDWLQVIGKGFLTDKEYKRLSPQYLSQLKGAPTTIFLLPVKR